MNQISQQAAKAFKEMRSFRKDNTEVRVDENNNAEMFLFGNRIAIRNVIATLISNAGCFNNTTKERLNAICGMLINKYPIYQKKFTWYYNDEIWDGTWKRII